MPQYKAAPAVTGVHVKGALPEPHPGVHPEPRVQHPRAATGELRTASGDPQRQHRPQRRTVPSQRLTEINDHRPWRAHFTIGRGTEERLNPLLTAHVRTLVLSSVVRVGRPGRAGRAPLGELPHIALPVARLLPTGATPLADRLSRFERLSTANTLTSMIECGILCGWTRSPALSGSYRVKRPSPPRRPLHHPGHRGWIRRGVGVLAVWWWGSFPRG